MTRLYRTAQLIVPALMRLLFRLRSVHPERVPAEGGLLIAANHASYLDPVLIGSATRRDLHYMARASLFRFRLFSWLIRGLQAHPLPRGNSRAALREAADLLRGGAALVVFPEGTRTPDGRLGEARAGVGHLALEAGVRIIPVHIEGSFQALPRHRRLPRFSRVTVSWGHPRTPEEWLARAPDETRPALAIARSLWAEVQDLGGLATSPEEDGGPPHASEGRNE